MFDSAVVEEGLGRLNQNQTRVAPKGTGAAPDGLGAYVDQNPYQQQYMDQQEYQQMEGPIDLIEPDDTSGGAAARSAGLTLLFVAVSTGIGYALRGGYGAVSGLLISSGTANVYRAQKWWGSPDPSEKHEAIVSSLFAVGEVFGGLFVGYKAYSEASSPLKD